MARRPIQNAANPRIAGVPADDASFTFEQDTFSGGANTVVDPRMVPPSQYTRGLNAYVGRDGLVHKRTGYLARDLTLDDAPFNFTAPTQLRWLVTELNDAVLIVWDNGSVYAVRADGTVELISDSTNEVGNPICTAIWDNSCYFSDGVSGLERIIWPYEDTAATARVTSDSDLISTKATGLAVNGTTIVVAYNDDLAVTNGTGISGAPEVTVHLNATTAWRADGAGHDWAIGDSVPSILGTPGFSIPRNPRGLDALFEAIENDVTAAATVDVAAARADLTAAAFDAYGRITSLGTINTTVPGGTTEFLGAVGAGTLAREVVDPDHSFAYLCARPSSERLFGVEYGDKTNIRWCDPFDPSKWGGLSVYSPGGEFIALCDTGEILCAFTRDVLYRIDGTDPSTWQARGVASDGLGCIAAGSVQVIEGIPVWLSPRGVAYFDGTRPKVLSTPVSGDVAAFTPAATAAQTGEHYLLYEGTHAILYDFRMSAWGSPFDFQEFSVLATSSHLRNALSRVITMIADVNVRGEDGEITSTAWKIVQQATDFTDLGRPYTFLVCSKTIDAARRTRDKIFHTAMAAVIAVTGATFSVGFQPEVNRADFAEDIYTVPAEAGGNTFVVRDRLPNIRANDGFVYVSSDDVHDVAVGALGADLFFASPR